ncbi:Wzz/FepE/Etk N-terminal domain-containing protein [Anaerolineales bacterium HSG24]|nr:Wzz/FepE/Etk N-terminal domain-containing protein [Anaerolineales bacterium HSG24]
MEEAIDLRQYVTVLLKYKYWLIIIPLLFAAVTYFGLSTRPPIYQSQATLSMLRLRSEIDFEPKYKIIEEQGSDQSARRTTLATLIESSAVASEVLPTLEADSKIETVEQLQNLIEVEPEGNLLIIKANATSPELATHIANSWAKQAEQYINEIYSQSSDQATELESKLAEAKTEYLDKQSAVENFIATNQIRTLNRQTTDLTQIRDKLYERHLTGLGLGLDTHYSLMTSASNDYFKTLLAQRQTVREKEEGQLVSLYDYYLGRQRSLNQLLTSANALKEQLTGSQSTAGIAGDALAVLQAKANAFNLGQGSSLQLNVDSLATLADEPQNYVVDVERLITQLEQEQSKTEVELETLSQALVNGDNHIPSGIVLDESDPLYQAAIERLETTTGLEKIDEFLPDYSSQPLYGKVAQLDNQINQLSAALEAEKAKQSEFTGERDLTWETYQTIQRKLAEVQVSEEAPASEVKFVVPAISPQKPLDNRILLNAIIAGIMGFVITMLVVFAIDWWQITPPTIKTEEKHPSQKPIVVAS